MHGRLCRRKPNPQSQRRAAQRPCSRWQQAKNINEKKRETKKEKEKDAISKE